MGNDRHMGTKRINARMELQCENKSLTPTKNKRREERRMLGQDMAIKGAGSGGFNKK